MRVKTRTSEAVTAAVLGHSGLGGAETARIAPSRPARCEASPPLLADQPRLGASPMPRAIRSALAMIVFVGLWPGKVGKVEASAI